MNNVPDLLQLGLVTGILTSLGLFVIMAASILVNPAIWAGDYPPDIKARFGPPDDRTQRQKRLVSLPFFLVLVGGTVYGLARLAQVYGGELKFLPAFLLAFTILFIFNLFDWLVIDWLFFVTLQPKWIILPGTEGMAGYKDYAFHFRGFLIGTVFSLVAALVIAGIAVLVTALI
jgi:hypothetical protein